MAQITLRTKRIFYDRLLYILIVLALGALGALIIVLLTNAAQSEEPAGNANSEPEQAMAAINSFASGSDGSDGPLVLTGTGTIAFDPRTFDPPLDPDGDHVFNFTSITVGPNITVVLKSPYLQAPVYWLATGDVQIDGIIDLSGGDGHGINDPVLGNRKIAIPGAGGYPGGIGESLPTNEEQPGSGPGGGGTQDGNNMHDGGGAGYSTTGSNCAAGNLCGQVYGNAFLVPLIGGSGGGGGSFEGSNTNSAGGGAGGGALLIASSTVITIDGTIKSNGGTGNGPKSSSAQGVGGSGSGGAIHLLAPIINGTGTLSALSFATNANYGWGSKGRIRLDAFQHEFSGSADPTPVLGTLFALFLPNNQPSLKVVNINGLAVPEVPTGEHGPSDVSLDTSAPVTVEVEAQYIPVGSMVTLHIYSENSGDQTISAPLVGTFEFSTTVLSATIPFGPSRFFVRSDWTP